MMIKLVAVAMAITSMVMGATHTPGDRAGCTEDELRSGTVCIHVEGDGVRYMDH